MPLKKILLLTLLMVLILISPNFILAEESDNRATFDELKDKLIDWKKSVLEVSGYGINDNNCVESRESLDACQFDNSVLSFTYAKANHNLFQESDFNYNSSLEMASLAYNFQNTIECEDITDEYSIEGVDDYGLFICGRVVGFHSIKNNWVLNVDFESDSFDYKDGEGLVQEFIDAVNSANYFQKNFEQKQDSDNVLSLDGVVMNQQWHEKIKGKIILKVESSGEAYYVHPNESRMHYLGRPEDAFSVMREQGVGISNIDLALIPLGMKYLSGFDSDQDGLPDEFEDVIFTNKNNKDTDGDGYDDKEELLGGYDPDMSQGIKKKYDSEFASKQKGRILLQVENNGEAWYVNPADGKRYFLGRPADAFNIMRNLGLGISNDDFNSL